MYNSLLMIIKNNRNNKEIQPVANVIDFCMNPRSLDDELGVSEKYSNSFDSNSPSPNSSFASESDLSPRYLERSILYFVGSVSSFSTKYQTILFAGNCKELSTDSRVCVYA